MMTLSTQQSQQLQELMLSEGYGSETELLNVMIADFKYQQQIRRLRKAIQAGLDSGEATKVENISDFLHSVMDKAKTRVNNG